MIKTFDIIWKQCKQFEMVEMTKKAKKIIKNSIFGKMKTIKKIELTFSDKNEKNIGNDIICKFCKLV